LPSITGQVAFTDRLLDVPGSAGLPARTGAGAAATGWKTGAGAAAAGLGARANTGAGALGDGMGTMRAGAGRDERTTVPPDLWTGAGLSGGA